MVAKKAAPKLDDLLNKEETTTETPEATEATETDVKFVDPHTDHVHIWTEDHDQNLARVQVDVIPALPPSEQPTTTRVITETTYAQESENDDTGRSVAFDSDESYAYDDEEELKF